MAVQANVQQRPFSYTTYHLVSANTTNANLIKGGAAFVFGWLLTNTNAAARYVKLYNKATAPTVGTDVPLLTITLEPSGVPQVVELDTGVRFGTGLGIGITTGAADSDTGAVAVNEIVVNLLYQ